MSKDLINLESLLGTKKIQNLDNKQSVEEIAEHISSIKSRLINLIGPNISEADFEFLQEIIDVTLEFSKSNLDQAFTMLYRLIDKLITSIHIGVYLVKFEDITEGYWKGFQKNQKELDPDFILDEDSKYEQFVNIIESQRVALKRWHQFLKFYNLNTIQSLWVLEGLMYLGSFDRELGKFRKRGRTTVNPIPEFNNNHLLLSIEFHDAVMSNNTEKLTEIYAKVPTLKELLRKKTLRFEDVYGTITAFLLSQIELEPVLEGQWHKIEKDNWREIQRISKDSPWCISNEVYAKDAAEKGPFFYFEVNGVVRVGISTIQHGIHLKKREIRGIDTDQKLDKIVKESKIVENKCRELKLQSLDVKSIEKYLRNWQTVITDQVKLLHLLSFNIKELDDQFEISKDRRREIANNHNAFINYVYNHPELLISIFPNLDLIIDSQESFGTINFSFVENLNQEQIHQLSQLNATVLIHLPEELSSMHIPENIVVISGFLDEFELVLKQSGENMESLPNDTWECNQFDVYKALRRGHLQVRALTLTGNFGNYAFLKKIKVETLILKNLINTYSSITSYDISAKKLIIKDSQLLIDNVEKLELLETHGFRSDSFISINNVDTVIIKDSEFGCKIDDSRKVEIDSSSLVCDIFKTQQVLTTNSSLEGDIFAHHVKLERLKCVRLLIDATSGELNDSEFSENLCLSGPVTCSKVTTSHLEAATMSVEGVSHKSRSFPFIKKSEVSGYLIDATEINSVFNMGQEDEQNIGDKHSINFENELSLIIPVQQSTQLDISILKKYYLGRLTFTGSKTIESLQFGSLEAGIIDLSELESLKGVDFGRIYTNKLILTGLKTIDGITDAFQNMFECDYESDAGIGVIILPKELKHEDFELPFAVENIKYI